MKTIAATKPYFSEDDISYISERFQDILGGKSFLSMGKYSHEFEESFARYIGTDYAVGCNSGTSALELIFRAIGIEGKEVIMPSNTFIATANAIMNAGGIPVFADCDQYMSLDYKDAISRITERTVGICHVHIGGLVTDAALQLAEYCENNNLFFVEDAAQAHGSSNQERKAGTLGIAAGFSFFSTKVMTTGEGGMVTTNDQDLVTRMKSIREFGKVKTGIFTNYHTQFGYNWRMPEVSALMGIRQLKAIEEFIQKRTEIAEIYDSILSGLNGIRIIKPVAQARFNYFKYLIILDNHQRELVHKAMEEKGIQLSGYVYELPLHLQPVFSEYNELSLPETEKLCAQHICLPIYPTLSKEDAQYIAEALIDILVSN